MLVASPDVAQQIFIGAGGFAVFCGTIYTYIKKARPAAGSDVAVVSATFADKRTIEELIEALDGLAQSERRRASALVEHTEATRQNTDALVNLLGFIRRDANSPLRGGRHLEGE